MLLIGCRPLSRGMITALLVALLLVLPSCGGDGDATRDTGSGSDTDVESDVNSGTEDPDCDEERGYFYEGDECAYCETLAHRHVQRVVSTVPEELLRCDAPDDRCISVGMGQSECRTNGPAFGCTYAVVNSRHVSAFREHEAEVAQQTCLAPGSTWQGCSGWWKWTCGDFPWPTCVSGVCVDAYTTDIPHVRPDGGPGDTHDRLPMRHDPDGPCQAVDRAELSICEWLSTMDGLLVGELVGIRVVETARDESGQPPPDGPLVRDCHRDVMPALELELEPLNRFGAAEEDAVTRVIVAPADLMHWIPQPYPNRAWGGIPAGVTEREADTLHAGTGRLMARQWRAPGGQTLVLPIVAGEPGDDGQPRYGLGGHPIGMIARASLGGSQTRALFQHDDTCQVPYAFAEDFRDRAPADFLSAVAACHAEGLPERPAEGVFLPEAPLPDTAFHSLCRETR